METEIKTENLKQNDSLRGKDWGAPKRIVCAKSMEDSYLKGKKEITKDVSTVFQK